MPSASRLLIPSVTALQLRHAHRARGEEDDIRLVDDLCGCSLLVVSLRLLLVILLAVADVESGGADNMLLDGADSATGVGLVMRASARMPSSRIHSGESVGGTTEIGNARKIDQGQVSERQDHHTRRLRCLAALRTLGVEAFEAFKALRS